MITPWRPPTALLGCFLLSLLHSDLLPLPPSILSHQPLTVFSQIHPKFPILRRPRSKTQAAESAFGLLRPRAPILSPTLPGRVHQTADSLPPTTLHTEHATHPRSLSLSNCQILYLFCSSPVRHHISPFTLAIQSSSSRIIPRRGSLTALCSEVSTIDHHHRFHCSVGFFFHLSPLVLIWGVQLSCSPTSHFRINDTIDSIKLLNPNPTSTSTA